MKTKKILLLFFCFLTILSCKRNLENKKEVLMECEKIEVNDDVPPPPPPPASTRYDYVMQDKASSSESDLYNPKLIKKGSLTISSSNIEDTKSIIYAFVKRCNGQVVNENLISNEPNSYYRIFINVQASLYDKFFMLIDSAKLNIISKSFSSQDVTMEYIDNKTRLDNKKKLEKRYLELLAKTKDIKDMLDIEEKLESIRSDIESRETQMNVMEKQIAFSEVHITIEKRTINVTYDEKNKYSYKLVQGLLSGWQGIKTFLVFLFSIWPFYILIILCYLIIRYVRNKNKK